MKDKKENEIEFHNITEELRKSNENLEQFAYAISHDLQEPLRTITSYCQLLKANYEKLSEDKKHKFIQYIFDSTMRMTWLTRDLLEFSRIGEMDKPLENINIKNIIEEIKDDSARAIQEANAIIKYDKLPVVRGVKIRIKQLFHNIISNSLKFKNEKNVIINIRSYKNTNKWIFEIEDNGIGIGAKYYERVFGVFKRLYPIEDYPGTGIGLAMCKKIVENHNGKIWIESEVEKGTIIYFSIPII